MNRDDVLSELRESRSKALLAVDAIDRAIEALGGDENEPEDLSGFDLIDAILLEQHRRGEPTGKRLKVIQGARD